MRLWLDEGEIVHCECQPGCVQTKADAEANMEAGWELGGYRLLPVIVDVRRVKSMDRGARVHYASSTQRTVGIAVLIGSPLSRVIGNFFIGLNKPLIPCQLFTAEPEALAWLRGLPA
jgi:hypothetical protein